MVFSSPYLVIFCIFAKNIKKYETFYRTREKICRLFI